MLRITENKRSPAATFVDPPRGATQFGWDPIFKPVGYDHTFAEMGIEEKNKISMRRMAVNQLKAFLAYGAAR